MDEKTYIQNIYYMMLNVNVNEIFDTIFNSNYTR